MLWRLEAEAEKPKVDYIRRVLQFRLRVRVWIRLDVLSLYTCVLIRAVHRQNIKVQRTDTDYTDYLCIYR
jgi:hypothetical protein